MKSLEYLIALSETTSINKAAKNLYISQQGLRHALDSLEAELGMALFERTRHGIVLNEAGRIALEHAKVITEEYASLRRDLADVLYRQQHAEQSGNTELIVSPYASLTLVDTLLAEGGLLQSIPIREWHKRHIIDELSATLEGGSDRRCEEEGPETQRFFLCDWLSCEWLANPSSAQTAPHGDAGQGRELFIETLHASHLGIICNTSHKLASRSSLTLADLSGVALASFSGQDYLSSIETAFSHEGLANRIITVSDPSTLLSYLKQHEDVCLVVDELSYLLERYKRGSDTLAFVPFRDAATINVGVISLQPDKDTSSYGTLVSNVIAACRKLLDAVCQ